MLGDGGELARQLDAGKHPGDLSTTTMMGATAHHIVAATEAAGIDPALPRAVRSLYDRAIAAGHGSDDFDFVGLPLLRFLLRNAGTAVGPARVRR